MINRIKNMSERYNSILMNLNPSVKMLLDKIRRFLSAGKASVMIGSGFSLNAENDGTGAMKDWNALNNELFYSLYSRKPTEVEMAGLTPVRLAAQVESTHGQKELDEIIMNALPDKSVYPGALHKKLMKLHWHDVFTTNYDTLLERSCDESGAAYSLVTTKDTLLYSKAPRIIKLHGSFPDVRPFIMSEDAFRTYAQKYPEFVNTVKQSLIENLFCMIGFSGNDPNFLSWMGWLRDVMGEKMTNAILICYNENGIHISEKQLFASRKIDILNLAEIEGLKGYKNALDFFLTYIGSADEKPKWTYPTVFLSSTIQKGKMDWRQKINAMKKARECYPGWVSMPDNIVEVSEISRFTFMVEEYKKVPDNLKVSFLYELDWFLEKCLYPKTADWFMEALKNVWDNFDTFDGKEKDMVLHLLVSLLAIYQESYDIDGYLKLSDYIEKKLAGQLTTQLRSKYYYIQCQWLLAKLEYNKIYSILLKWHLMENDFLGALWQASVYREIGDEETADDMLLSYYSRLTTRILLDDKSMYLSSCIQLYSFVMPRVLRRRKIEISIDEDNTVFNRTRRFIDEMLKERKEQEQNHGFNLGQVSNIFHMYQVGFANGYLCACRYLHLLSLHGNIYSYGMCSEKSEYAKVLGTIAQYKFGYAVSLLIRGGNGKVVDMVVSRETLNTVDKADVYVIFCDLFEMLKELVDKGNSRQRNIVCSVVVPILQRLSTKGDDSLVDDLFDFVMEHLPEKRFKHNDVLKTIYDAATKKQKTRMMAKVMSTPICREEFTTDILWPENTHNVDVTDEMVVNATKYINNKELKPLSYTRVLELLQCNTGDTIREHLKKIIVQWRLANSKDSNAFYSYNVFPAQDVDDQKNLENMEGDAIKNFLGTDYKLKRTSEDMFSFSFSLDSLVPALPKMSHDTLEKVIEKICQTLESYMPRLKEDNSSEFMGGFRHMSDYMFQEFERSFSQIDFSNVSSEKRKKLSSLLYECYEAKNPCLWSICIVDKERDKGELVEIADKNLFAKKKQMRADAMWSLIYIFEHNRKLFSSKNILALLFKLSYFLEYSQSRNTGEYLMFIARLFAINLLDVSAATTFEKPLLAISGNLGNYDVPYEYKVDIAHNACVLCGVLFKKGIESEAVLTFKAFSEDFDVFRDIRNGFEKGMDMVKNENSSFDN